LAEHKGKVTVFIPHYAMSGGTLIALAAAEIVMDRNAVLGPVDPQIGDVAASSILKVVQLKKGDRERRNIDDGGHGGESASAGSRVYRGSFD
jgi:ClpP class serine protease